MKYRYTARTKTGELQVGYVEGANRDGAAQVLTGHDLFVLTLEDAERRGFLARLLSFVNRVRRADLMVFTRQFATMMEAKIRIADALRTLYAQTKHAGLKDVVFEVSSDVDAGLSLSQAFERHGEVFSEFYVNLVRSAEVTGRLEEAMGFLADYLEKEAVLASKVRSALIYPAFVVVLFFAISGVLVGLVFPQIAPIFEESAVELPFVTELLLGAGTLVRDWWVGIVLLVLFIAAGLIEYARSEEGKALTQQLALGTPGVGTLVRKLYTARFAETASVLLKGGIPVTQSVEVASRTIGSAPYAEALRDVAQGVREGELLSQALSRWSRYFPPLVSQMVAVGEQTGTLDKMFARVSAFYTREVESAVNNLVELIQPTLILVIGGLVGIVFAAILFPLYNLIQAF